MGNEQSSGSGSGGSNDKVKTDKESFGGETMRGWDHTLSEKLGGYKSGQEPGIYGKYVEPTLHAAVHTARGIGNRNFFCPFRALVYKYFLAQSAMAWESG